MWVENGEVVGLMSSWKVVRPDGSGLRSRSSQPSHRLKLILETFLFFNNLHVTATMEHKTGPSRMAL